MKNKLLIIGFIVFLFANIRAQISADAYYNYLKDSYTKVNSDIIEFVIKDFNSFYRTYNDYSKTDELLFMLADLYTKEKMHREAFATFMKIKFLYPKSARQADTSAKLNQIMMNDAERMFRERRTLIIDKISKPIPFNNLNQAYYDYLSYLHEIDIEDVNQVLVNEINLYMHLYTSAAKNVEQLIFWLAELYEKNKDWEEAVATYFKLTYLAPQSKLIPAAMYRIAFLQYDELRMYPEAKDNFVNLITNYPEIPVAGDAQFYLAELYHEKLKNKNEAVANYRLLVETYPDNKNAVEALKRVAELKEDEDNYEEAIGSYYQIFELYPQAKYAPEALKEMESLYRKKLNNYEKAIETLKIYASQYPQIEDAAEMLFDAADMFEDDLNNKQAAIETFHQVINQFPKSKYAEKAKDRIEDLSKK